MAGQEQIRPTRRGDGDDGSGEDAGQVSARTEHVDTGVDDLLSEIDGVLETNAEEFVKSFVQKGGQ